MVMKTCCHHYICYYFQLAARVLLYAPSHTQDCTYHSLCWEISWWKEEGNVLFNDTLNTFYLRLYGIGHMIEDHSDSERRNPLPPLPGLLFSISIILLYAPSHRQDSTYHSLCYISHGALAETKNTSVGLPWRINPTTHRTMSKRSYHGATSRS